MNVPSNGLFHQYPVDCWRFYPDSGHALVTWAKRNGYRPLLLESFTDVKNVNDGELSFNDFVAVFLKDAATIEQFPERILDSVEGFTNGYVNDKRELLNRSNYTEDQQKIAYLLSNQK
ncbi:MAG: hypothetical protein QM523_01565 [Candidatus Pacebacteria bacterium]|nr:hypothetical protein [Candidatus Paceibacterota bacterium]